MASLTHQQQSVDGHLTLKEKKTFAQEIAASLERYLERRFAADHLTNQELFSPSASESPRNPVEAYIMVKTGDEPPSIEITNMVEEDEVLLRLSIPHSLILRHDGEFVLERKSEKLMAKVAERYVRMCLEAGCVPPDDEIEPYMLRNGDVLFEASAPPTAWLTHPQGILVDYGTDDGIFLNNLKLQIYHFDRLEPCYNGALYSTPDSTPEHTKIVKVSFEFGTGGEEVLYEGPCVYWAPHPQGAAVQVGDEVLLNGKQRLYKGDDLGDTWVLSEGGRVLTTRLIEEQTRSFPDARLGYYPLTHYAEFLVEGGRNLYELKYEWWNSQQQTWVQHGTWKQSMAGVVAYDYPERMEFDECRRVGSTSKERFAFFHLSERASGKGSEMVWRPGHEVGPDDWYPSVEAGRVNGIVERVGNSFIFRSDLPKFK